MKERRNCRDVTSSSLSDIMFKKIERNPVVELLQFSIWIHYFGFCMSTILNQKITVFISSALLEEFQVQQCLHYMKVWMHCTYTKCNSLLFFCMCSILSHVRTHHSHLSCLTDSADTSLGLHLPNGLSHWKCVTFSSNNPNNANQTADTRPTHTHTHTHTQIYSTLLISSRQHRSICSLC